MKNYSNYVSYGLSFLEIFLYGGAVYGFGFIQYIFEKEGVFWDELCYSAEKHPNCTFLPDEIIDCPYPKEPCEASRKMFNDIYTWFLLSSSFSVLFLQPILNKFGLFAIRVILGILTTTGATFMVFYGENPNCLWVTWQLMGFASTMYIIVNIKEQCSNFASVRSFTIGMVNGTYDASAGIFLLFKFIYTSSLALPFKDLLVFYAIGTASIWFKTFLFAPFKNLKNPESENYSVFENSVVKSCTVQKPAINSANKENSTPANKRPIYDSIVSIDFLFFTLFFTVLTVRISSVPAWILPWLQWTFVELENADEYISICLDIYGFMFYASLIISPLPGFLFNFLEKLFKSKRKSEIHGLTILLAFAVICSTIISFQMCLQGSVANAVAVVIEYSFLRTVFFITRSMYLFMYFPEEHFGFLYGLSLVPIAASQYLIDPMFQVIINGDDIKDADFSVVSFWLGIACLACILMIVYNIFKSSRRYLPNEKPSESPESQSEEKLDDRMDFIEIKSEL